MNEMRDLESVLSWIYEHGQLKEDFKARFPELAARIEKTIETGEDFDQSFKEKEMLQEGYGYEVGLNGGKLDIAISPDPDYPGMDIEFQPKLGFDVPATYPRVLFEQNQDTGAIRLLVWDNPLSEDYTREIPLTDAFMQYIQQSGLGR